MKRKYFLRGIGVGILFSTIVLFTAYSISGGKQISDDEVIKRAEELGMVQAESSMLDHLTKPADSEEPTSDSENASTTDTSSEIMSTTELSSENASSTDASSEEATTTEEPQTVTITVAVGMNASEVSKILYDAGAIDDAAAFNAYLIANGRTGDIKVGEFTVEVGADFEAIVKIITGR